MALMLSFCPTCFRGLKVLQRCRQSCVFKSPFSQFRCSADARATLRVSIMTGETVVMMERSVTALHCSSLQHYSVTLTRTSSHAVTQHLPITEPNRNSYKARRDDGEDDVTLTLVVCKAFIWERQASRQLIMYAVVECVIRHLASQKRLKISGWG